MGESAVDDVVERAHRPVVRTVGWLSWLAFGLASALAWAAVWRVHAVHGSHHTSGAGLGLTVLAWLAMTAAMMLPTTVPMLRALREVLGADHRGSSIEPRWWAFIGGYLAVWSGASMAGAAVQRTADAVGLVGASGGARTSWLIAGVLLLAGAYQFSSVKRQCQQHCVSPMTFFWRWWRDGVEGAWRMGLRHGVLCLGCCWALMLLALVGGTADLLLMALCTVLMVLDKLPGVGERMTAPLGAALVAAGTVMAVLAITAAGPDSHSDLHGADHPSQARPSSTPIQERVP